MTNQVLINGKLLDLQELLKYFNGITTPASNALLPFGVFHSNFVLYSKDLLAIVLLLLSAVFHLHHHLLNLYNNSTNSLSQNNFTIF